MTASHARYWLHNGRYKVQLNLSLTEYTCSMGSTRHIFISHVCKLICAHKIDHDKPTVKSSKTCVRTRRVYDSLQMHTCMSGMHTPNLDYACMQIVSQGQWNKLYKHVHVLRCNPLMIQDINPAKKSYHKAKAIRGCVFY